MTLAAKAPAWRDPLLPAYLAVASTGLYLTSFGPSIPFVAHDLAISKATAGLLITALFLGSIAASGIVTWRFHGGDQRRLAAAGVLCLAIGGVLMGASPWWPLALASCVVLGAGDGLLVTAAHILVADESPDIPRDMSRLNVCFAMGAVAGPLWTGFALDMWDSRLIVYLALVAFSAPTALLLLPGRRRQHIESPRAQTGAGFDLAAVLIGGAILLYVGAEAGLGAWVASYTEETFGSGVMASATVTSGYWAALGIGRLASAWALDRGLGPWRLLIGAITLAGLSAIALAIASGSFTAGAAAAFATGLGLGPIWPSCFGIAAEGRQPRVAAILVTLGSVGGIVLPYSQGLLIDASGPRTGIAMTAILCAGMLALTLAARAQGTPRARVEPRIVAIGD
ncbi:MAG: MFS transporter [Dehalococcoidia bacterium]|nr:MFS transporter [Dehalococcoidia bacterium]